MASESSYKNQNSSYRGIFQWIFDQGKENLVWVSGEFELSQFRVNRVKMTDKWGEIQGKSDLVRVSGEFELSEFELSAFYCIYIYVISYPQGFLKAFVGIPPQGI